MVVLCVEDELMLMLCNGSKMLIERSRRFEGKVLILTYKEGTICHNRPKWESTHQDQSVNATARLCCGTDSSLRCL